MLPELSDKDVNIRDIAYAGLLSELLEKLKLKEETIRYNCFKVLMLISEERGEVLYSERDYFIELLGSGESVAQYVK